MGELSPEVIARIDALVAKLGQDGSPERLELEQRLRNALADLEPRLEALRNATRLSGKDLMTRVY